MSCTQVFAGRMSTLLLMCIISTSFLLISAHQGIHEHNDISASIVQEESRNQNLDSNEFDGGRDLRNDDYDDIFLRYVTLAPTMSSAPSITMLPSEAPTPEPSILPSMIPTNNPTFVPTDEPSIYPSFNPSSTPSIKKSAIPTTKPSYTPTAMPSEGPTVSPTSVPTYRPTVFPSDVPTTFPTSSPSDDPSAFPSGMPSLLPSASSIPSKSPSPTVVVTVPISTFSFHLDIADDLEVDEMELIRVTEAFLLPKFQRKVPNFKRIILMHNEKKMRRRGLSFKRSVDISGVVYFNKEATRDAYDLNRLVQESFDNGTDEFFSLLQKSGNEALRSVPDSASIGFTPGDFEPDGSNTLQEASEGGGRGSKYILVIVACVSTLVGVTVSLLIRRHRQMNFEKKIESMSLSHKEIEDAEIDEEMCIEIANDGDQEKEDDSHVTAVAGENASAIVPTEPQPIRIGRDKEIYERMLIRTQQNRQIITQENSKLANLVFPLFGMSRQKVVSFAPENDIISVDESMLRGEDIESSSDMHSEDGTIDDDASENDLNPETAHHPHLESVSFSGSTASDSDSSSQSSEDLALIPLDFVSNSDEIDIYRKPSQCEEINVQLVSKALCSPVMFSHS